MDRYRFNSQMQLGGKFDFGFDQTQVKNEPMFFNSDLEFAWEKGGPITRDFLEQFERDLRWQRDFDTWEPENFVFDSRVHMLMPKWFPCIPGYHHDDVPRNTTNGQPDYTEARSYRSKHCMGLVGGDICPTQFAIGECALTIPEHDIIYKHWHPEVEQLIADGKLELVEAQSGRTLYFDCDTLHQGQASRGNGWRWFGRISWNTDRVNHVTNEFRHQVQVYLEYPMEGW